MAYDLSALADVLYAAAPSGPVVILVGPVAALAGVYDLASGASLVRNVQA